MEKDIMYTLDIHKENIEIIEKYIRENFDVKFLAYDQYELKVSFCKELSEKEEEVLFKILTHDNNKN